MQTALLARTYVNVPDPIGTILPDFASDTGIWGSTGYRSDTMRTLASQYIENFDEGDQAALRRGMSELTPRLGMTLGIGGLATGFALMLATPLLLAYLLRDAAALGGAGAEVKLGSPDAGLIAACEAFDKLEWEYHSFFSGPTEIRDDDALAEATNRIAVVQESRLRLICELRATTLAGHLARIGTVALNDEQMQPGEMLESEFVNERLMEALLRDLADHAGAMRAVA